MALLSDEQLIAFNKRGIIPGPYETEEDFIKRAHFCLGLRQELSQSSDIPASFEQIESNLSQSILKPAFAVSEELFDITPDWIPIVFSNDQMPPWHGGCAWIFQLSDDTPTAALLQLRKQFYNAERYLGLYDRTEIASHELSHVGRMLFEEPRFEEVLAYRTSKSRLRRWLGPIVESAKESLWFVLLLGVLVMADIALIATGQHQAYEWAMWFKAMPLAIVGYGLLRLSKRQRQFDRCLRNLEIVYSDKKIAQAVIYRLTDQEIESFSAQTAESIRSHIQQEQEAPSSLRWRLITVAYQ